MKRDILERIETIDSLPKEVLQKQLSKLKTELSVTIEEGEKLSILQEEVHTINAAFEEQLRAKVPGITTQEIKYCSLLRLGMDNQQIAQILNKSDVTIRTYKYRINKKAGLQGKDDLRKLVDSL